MCFEPSIAMIIHIIIIIIDNFCIVLFSAVTKLTAFYNILQLLYSAILWCNQTHCSLQYSPTFSKFHKHNTYNYDN